MTTRSGVLHLMRQKMATRRVTVHLMGHRARAKSLLLCLMDQKVTGALVNNQAM